MDTSILGTGLSGLVGSRIVELNPDLKFPDLSLDTGVNILNPAELDNAFSSFSGKSVIHLAAFTDTNAAWEQKGDKSGVCYQINVVGTQNIVDMCRKHDKHLIHISTDFVFDGQKDGQYLESDLPNPLDWYGATKAEAEKIVTNSGISSAIIRIAFPYRAICGTKIDIVRKIKSKLENGETVTMFTDQITTPTFIDDIAAGVRHLADSKANGIYHLVGSSSQSPYDMALSIAEVFNLDKSLVKPSSLAEYLKTPGARPYAPKLALSNSKFSSEYFTPKSLIDGLKELKNQL